MSIKKEIVVLTGGGHKGIVKMQSCSQNMIEGYCNLDYRPVGAVLYLVGDNIAEIALKDINTAFKVEFYASAQFACMIRSTSVTMFGGGAPKHETIARVDKYLRRKNADKDKTTPVISNIKTDNIKSKNIAVESVATASACGDNVGRKGDMVEENGRKEIADEPKNLNAKDVEENGASIMAGDNSKECAECENDVKTQYGNKNNGTTLPSMKDLEEWVKYDGNNFYYAVKPQLDEMFICYPEDETLNENVQNSKWVRVEAEDGYFVVGVLFNDSEPSYICYGVPSRANTQPPQELQDMCVWLPIDNDFGYWVIYQSARSGEIIK